MTNAAAHPKDSKEISEPMPIQPTSAPSAWSAEIIYTASDAERHAIRVTSPVKFLSLVPYLVGFHPGDSLVVIGMTEPKGTVRVTLRYPLHQAGIQNLAAFSIKHAVNILTAQQCSRAVVVGYGSEAQVVPFVDRLRDAAVEHDIVLSEILRAEDQRYWSYVCTDPSCCPPEGTPYELKAAPGLACLLAAGIPDILTSRESLAATVASVTGADATAMRRATRRAEARIIQLLEQAPVSAADEPSGHALVVREGIKAMTATMQQYQGGGDISRNEAAWLTVSLRDIQVRDDAWSRLKVEHRKANLGLLLELTRLARRGYVAPSATLLAFVAWQSGNGALANVALDRALDDDGSYRMAQLIRQAVSLGLPPSLARVPLTPEQVAEEYAKQAAAGKQT